MQTKIKARKIIINKMSKQQQIELKHMLRQVISNSNTIQQTIVNNVIVIILQQQFMCTFIHITRFLSWLLIIIIYYLAAMIRKLPQTVINQISAGEVIQRPFNVIKELVQNSIDADATQINVQLHQGGMKLIKISDNGKGIMLQDFPLLCARFATSKIKEFSDMQQLSSFGFRGEALASLSYVSNLTIASKWNKDSVGHSANFRNQKIQGKINDIAMNTGTTITASDLFVKLESRRASLNPAEEKKKIYKLLCHFCLHYPHIRFSLISQKGDEGLPRSKSDTVQNQAKMQVFQQITKLSFDKLSYIAPCKIGHGVQFQAIMTKINCCTGKTLMLNINNRIVENVDLFKTIEKAYSQCYQSIHEENETFWVYINLKIDPKLIDCNVHPTKKAVGIFSSTQIYQQIKQLILIQIRRDSAIKILKQSTQTLNIQDAFRKKMSLSLMRQNTSRNIESQGVVESKPKTVYAFEKNRTDAKQLPITFYSQTQPIRQISHQRVDKQNLVFQYRFVHAQRNMEIKKFFGECSYVGCYGLSCILLHYQNKLYMTNIQPLLPSFIPNHCQSNPLHLKHPHKSIHISTQLQIFLQKTKLLKNSKQIIEWIRLKQNKERIKNQYGICIIDDQIIYYPCLGDIFIQCLDQDDKIGWEIAYLVVRVGNAVWNGRYSEEMRDKFMVQFVSAQFYEERDQLSPFNEKISNFFKNRVIPVLKTNPIMIGKPINPHNYMKQMLDLKDIYKIFERC